jgi:DNA-binding NtrC family response regulator
MADPNAPLDLTQLTEDLERRTIEEALRRCSGAVTEAARFLKVTRRVLAYKMNKLGIKLPNIAANDLDDSTSANTGPSA